MQTLMSVGCSHALLYHHKLGLCHHKLGLYHHKLGLISTSYASPPQARAPDRPCCDAVGCCGTFAPTCIAIAEGARGCFHSGSGCYVLPMPCWRPNLAGEGQAEGRQSQLSIHGGSQHRCTSSTAWQLLSFVTSSWPLHLTLCLNSIAH